jgi:hypothetical protein
MKKTTLKVGSRVTVSDGPGFTLGRGTVLEVIDLPGRQYIPIVRVCLDDSGDDVTCPAASVTPCKD